MAVRRVAVTSRVGAVCACWSCSWYRVYSAYSCRVVEGTANPLARHRTCVDAFDSQLYIIESWGILSGEVQVVVVVVRCVLA